MTVQSIGTDETHFVYETNIRTNEESIGFTMNIIGTNEKVLVCYVKKDRTHIKKERLCIQKHRNQQKKGFKIKSIGTNEKTLALHKNMNQRKSNGLNEKT